jgi:iron-sulfur cluster insertion protein
MESSTMARTVGLTEKAAGRITALKRQEGNDRLMLRISVTSGGCSGFSYHFDLETETGADDHLFASHGETIVVDDASLDLLSGSVLDFEESLMGSMFVMKNPNATATCGCGTSFAA